MRVIKENTAAGIVTITPEKQAEINRRLVDYRVSVGVLKSLRDSGRISASTYRKGVKAIGKKMGFDSSSIFAETA